MAETITNQEQALVKPEILNGEDKTTGDYINEFKGQAQDYGQKIQEAAVKAKDYAGEKLSAASDKFKELQGKDPQELVENAKEYARQNPGQSLLIAAAAGLVIGLILKGGRR